MTTLPFLDPSMLDGVARLFLQHPQVSAAIGGLGLGNLFYHLPRFAKEKTQTIGIGVLTAGYLLDSASHILIAGSSIGALGIATVGLLAGGTALATYAGLKWAENTKHSKSKFATAAVAGFAALHFGSHAYIAARALLGTVNASVSLFGTGILGLLANLGLVVVAAYTLYQEVGAHGNGRTKSERTTPATARSRASRSRPRPGTGRANLIALFTSNRKPRLHPLKAAGG